MMQDSLNTVKGVHNPINYARLPKDYRDLSLDYRTDPASDSQKTFDTEATIFFITLGAFVLTAIVRLLGPMLATGWAVSTGASIGFIAAVVYFFFTRELRKAVFILIAGPITPLVLAVFYHATNIWVLRVIALVIACGLVALLADAMANHYARWLLANPRLSRRTRELRSRWWASRLNTILASSYEGEDGEDEEVGKRRRKDLSNLHSYKPGFLFPAVFLLGLLPIWLPTACIIIVVPAILAGVLLVSFRCPLRTVLRVTGRAIVSWFTYGWYTPDAPGLWRSPHGGVWRRVRMTSAVTILLAISLLPTVAYMPFVFQFETGGVWDKLFAPMKEQHSYSWDSKVEYAHELGINLLSNAPGMDSEEDATVDDSYGGELWERDRDEWLRREEARFELHREYEAWKERQLVRWENEVNAASFAAAEPENWMVLAAMGAKAGYQRFIWAFIFAALGSLLLPLFAIGCTLLVVAGPTLARLYDAVEAEDAYEAKERGDDTPWTQYVARLEEAEQQKEREHLWLGVHRDEDYPVLLDPAILREHSYFVGDSGSGKTALGITPLISQLIRRTDHGMVIIDLKGDNALFQAAREESQNAGRTFKWFTNELGRSSYIFNPFSQHEGREHVSVNQVCETMLEALNLNHGEGYGRSYFSRVARRWLSSTLRTHPQVESFEELYEIASQPENFQDDKEAQDVFELLSVIESLATFRQLNAEDGEEAVDDVQRNGIYMPDVIAEGQVAYFWLPAAGETATVREIGKLALYALITSAYQQVREHGEAKQTYLVIDEFQRIASEGFKLILQQARSMGVGAILANQTSADLKTNDTDLRATVQTNTRFKWCFSATDLDQQKDIMTASGETIYHTRSWSWKDGESVASSQSAGEKLMPRITRNDVIRTSDDTFQSIVQVSRGSGYTQLSGFSIPLVSSYHITEEVYARRNKEQWPEPNEHTVVGTQPPMNPERFISAEDRLRDSKIILEEDAVGEEEAVVPEIRVTATEPPSKTKKEGRVASMLSQMKAEHDGEEDDV